MNQLYGGFVKSFDEEIAIIEVAINKPALGYLPKTEITSQIIENIWEYLVVGEFVSFHITSENSDGTLNLSIRAFHDEPRREVKLKEHFKRVTKCPDCHDYMANALINYVHRSPSIDFQYFPAMQCLNETCLHQTISQSDIEEYVELALSKGVTHVHAQHLKTKTTLTLSTVISFTFPPSYAEYLLELIDFRGTCNHELVLQTVNHHGMEREGKNVLTGNEMIYGDYLLFDSAGHDDRFILFSLESVEDIERNILSGGGFLNPFTTDQIAIIFGELKRFEIRGVSHDGNPMIFKKFDNEDAFEQTNNIWVHWID